MNKDQYIIESGLTLPELTQRVNSSMRAGYRPHGSLIAVVPAQIPAAEPSQGTIYFLQPMIHAE